MLGATVGSSPGWQNFICRVISAFYRFLWNIWPFSAGSITGGSVGSPFTEFFEIGSIFCNIKICRIDGSIRFVCAVAHAQSIGEGCSRSCSRGEYVSFWLCADDDVELLIIQINFIIESKGAGIIGHTPAPVIIWDCCECGVILLKLADLRVGRSQIFGISNGTEIDSCNWHMWSSVDVSIDWLVAARSILQLKTGRNLCSGGSDDPVQRSSCEVIGGILNIPVPCSLWDTEVHRSSEHCVCAYIDWWESSAGSARPDYGPAQRKGVFDCRFAVAGSVYRLCIVGQKICAGFCGVKS